MIESKKGHTSSILPRGITKEQSKDSGLALVLICLIIYYFFGYTIIPPLMIILVLVLMTVPKLLFPFAFLWLSLSNVLGLVMSKIVLGLLFYLLVTPVGMIRKALGKDSMKVKAWKKDTTSVFVVRDHVFQPEDIEKPY